MTRRKIENKIDDLEQSVNTDKKGIWILDEQPDGSYQEYETDKRIKMDEIPENALVITL
jgi:hypothetical protein